MFNIILHVLILLVALGLGVFVNVDGQTYGFFYLFGLRQGEAYYIIATVVAVALFLLILFIAYKYKSVSNRFYTFMYKGQNDEADELLKKYYKQNKPLFYYQNLFRAFVFEDMDTLRRFAAQKSANKKKGLTALTYVYLLEMKKEGGSEIDVKELILQHGRQNAKNPDIAYLLNALKCCQNNKKFEAYKYIKKISKNFLYPSIQQIIDEVVFK